MSASPFTVLSSRVAYENPWLQLREDRFVRTDDGSTGVYSVVTKPDFALVVPQEPDGDLWLVEQYRYPVSRRCWELPQGSLVGRPDADPLEIAAVELREETGLTAGRLHLLGTLFAAYGFCSQRYHVVLATDLDEGPPDRESTEVDMVSRRFARAEVERMVAAGELQDAHTLAGLALLDRLG